MRFVMALEMTPAELDFVKDVDLNCSKHISVVNDIYSWEKELKQAEVGHSEGSAICSSVQVMSQEANVSIEQSQRILWAMCREWELCHLSLVAQKGNMKPHVKMYCKGLEYQMSGNELWSKSTKRYIGLVD